MSSTTTPIVSVDQLCKAIETALTADLQATMTLLGFTDAKKYPKVRDWQQVPTVQALSSATLPAGAITTPGLTEPPTWIPRDQLHRGTWRVAVGAYVRGRDHDTTAGTARDFAAGIRTTVLRHRDLGGIAEKVRWYGEEYALIPGRESARTVAGVAVAFDVTAYMAIDLPADPQDLPLVTTTSTPLTVR